MNYLKPIQQLSSAVSSSPLKIGLVNNAPARGRAAVERQFTDLLGAAAAGRSLNVHHFTCGQTAPAPLSTDQPATPAAEIDHLFDQQFDTVIVTGMEPRGGPLPDEPIWHAICRIADWAEHHAVPVVWSCLAAHAAILHLDGLGRERLPKKLSGIFASDIVPHHPLTEGLPSSTSSPHSRYHDVPEAILRARGCTILSRSAATGADIFLRTGPAPSVFLQGHLEYDPGTLLLEYRRDVRRYVMGQLTGYPEVPENCVDPDTEAALRQLQTTTVHGSGDPGSFGAVTALLERVVPRHCWRDTAIRFYANWLRWVAGTDEVCATPVGQFAAHHEGVGP